MCSMMFLLVCSVLVLFKDVLKKGYVLLVELVDVLFVGMLFVKVVVV